jgi:hypothetical protein
MLGEARKQQGNEENPQGDEYAVGKVQDLTLCRTLRSPQSLKGRGDKHSPKRGSDEGMGKGHYSTKVLYWQYVYALFLNSDHNRADSYRLGGNFEVF